VSILGGRASYEDDRMIRYITNILGEESRQVGEVNIIVVDGKIF